MSSRNNGDIRGFFKSAGTSTSQPQPQKQPASSSHSDLPLSPRTPRKPRVFRRDEEIKGSDDSEDDDSDDSLGSITGALGYRTGPAAHRHDPNILSTPQAKRIASGIHRSPLTLQTKKHKFDLEALISHSREIERTEESFRKADAVIAQTGYNSDISDDSDAENDSKRLDEAACKLFVGPDDEDGKGDKLRRAVKRSRDGEASSRKHCYFFSQEEPPPKPGRTPFPRKQATGRWKCLSEPDAREQAFIMGLPHMFLAKGTALPDEIFLWVLDEICREQNAELRMQYVNLTELCEDNTTRLIDDTRLYALLEGIGGPECTREPTKFKGTRDVRYEYLEERDWSPLVTFLQLLDKIAPALRTKSAISAVQLLLRMSMDPVVAAVVGEHYTRPIATLVTKLAKSESKWNKAREAICSYIYKNVDDLELRVTALLSIPSTTLFLIDLRRHIAAQSLFNHPGLGSKPTDSLSFERLRDRIDEDDFKSTNRADFDFERLRALVTLLDIVIDSADFMRTSIPDGDTTPTPEDAAAERQFNAEIDILADRVKVIHDKIRDKASRKNVKLSLLGLEKRLKYAIRTHPPPKKSIFAYDGPSTKTEPDVNIPKQRDFMRQWAQKKKAEKQDREDSMLDVPEDQDREDDMLNAHRFKEGRRRRGRPPKGLPVAVG